VTVASRPTGAAAHGTMGGVQLHLVDAFTSSPFTGNPAGVCLTDATDAAWMQAVAAEVNVSETAFVDLSTLGATGEVGLRWFTPKVEVEICGHATLASAHVLFEQGLASSPIAFRTAAGVLRAEGLPGGGIQLDFPVDEPVSALPDGHLADEFADALGAAVVELARCRYDVLVEIPSPAEVRDLEPDLSVLRAASGRGVIVTARAEDDPTPGAPDFVSRFFAPAVGIDEDPVTGSAHCCLAPWWAERLGRNELAGWQASPRGGRVGVRLLGGRVELVGHAVTVLRGELLA
jgi:PhzF family phenazine biosynthesis protein